MACMSSDSWGHQPAIIGDQLRAGSPTHPSRSAPHSLHQWQEWVLAQTFWRRIWWFSHTCSKSWKCVCLCPWFLFEECICRDNPCCPPGFVFEDIQGSIVWNRNELDSSLSCIGEGNGNPLQCSCLENPRDGGASWAAIYGVAQSRPRMKRLSSCSRLIIIIQQERSWVEQFCFIWIKNTLHSAYTLCDMPKDMGKFSRNGVNSS